MTAPRDRSIVVVSGLPRSGTSMAMRMLEAGGVPILSDGLRVADEDNPRGYFELEAVKHLHTASDAEWLDRARGHAVKIISFLLTWLPETYDYRVVFMRRDLHEVLASQQTMLGRRGEAETTPKSAQETMTIYEEHLRQVDRFLKRRACFTTLDVDHAATLRDPGAAATQIAAFVGGPLDVAAMAAAVDPALHRQRRATPST
jgi:hypothetical protein